MSRNILDKPGEMAYDDADRIRMKGAWQMSEKCVHAADIRFGEFLRQYFKKDGILAQPFRCKNCTEEIYFVKAKNQIIWDALIWIIILAFMLFVRFFKDTATLAMPLWVYILIAVIAVSLIGLALDMLKEWYLLQKGTFHVSKHEQPPAPTDSNPDQ